MKTWLKVSMSTAGAFVSGMTAAYSANPAAPRFSLLMAGLVPVGAYMMGFSQLNPRLRRK